MKKVGVIPFKTQDEAVAILFVTSQTRGRWILPKGTVNDSETPVEACHREGFEEAGVRGVLLEQYPITAVVGKQTDTGLEQVPVTYYPLLVQSQEAEWPEKDRRERHWALIEDATKVAYRADFLGLLQVVQDLRPWLKTASEQNK